jgi:superfamily II DNA helicase RecQ
VHYDPPADHKDYLHRSGRTARAGHAGTVVSFVQTDQMQDVRKVHQNAKVDPTVERVAPGHHLVRAMASSGEPVAPTVATLVTVPLAPFPGAEPGNRPRRPRSRGRRA